MIDRKAIKSYIVLFVLSIAALSFLYPFYWMIVASLIPEANISSFIVIPKDLTFDNYLQMFSKIPIGRALINSVIVAVMTTSGVILFGAMTGYALAKLSFKGKNLLFFAILFTMTLPFQITLIPNYITMVKFQWIDSMLALVIPGLNSAFAILLFRQAFKALPDSLIQAARVDGCNEWQIVFLILLPNVIPSIITVGIITFMNSWNEVM